VLTKRHWGTTEMKSRTSLTLAILAVFFSFSYETIAAVPNEVPAAVAKEKGCLSCHEGIEKFTDGPMMEAIEALGADVGDPPGCVTCHGGTPTGTTKDAAHKGVPESLKSDGGPQLF